MTKTAPWPAVEVDLDAIEALADAEEAWLSETCPNPHPYLPRDGHWAKGHDMHACHPLCGGEVDDPARCTGCGSLRPTTTASLLQSVGS